jgi:hypothetical protein
MPYTDLHDRIKRSAYSLWEQGGRPEGRVDEHWVRAEAEVTGADTSEEAGPCTPGAGAHACPACEGTARGGRGRCKQCDGTGRIIDAPEP